MSRLFPAKNRFPTAKSNNCGLGAGNVRFVSGTVLGPPSYGFQLVLSRLDPRWVRYNRKRQEAEIGILGCRREFRVGLGSRLGLVFQGQNQKHGFFKERLKYVELYPTNTRIYRLLE
jgi:hypothetical protein